MKPVLKEHLKVLNLISLLLCELHSVQVIDTSHHFAELGNISPCDKEMSVQHKWIISIYIVSHLTLRGVPFDQRCSTQQAISLRNIKAVNFTLRISDSGNTKSVLNAISFGSVFLIL